MSPASNPPPARPVGLVVDDGRPLDTDGHHVRPLPLIGTTWVDRGRAYRRRRFWTVVLYAAVVLVAALWAVGVGSLYLGATGSALRWAVGAVYAATAVPGFVVTRRMVAAHGFDDTELRRHTRWYAAPVGFFLPPTTVGVGVACLAATVGRWFPGEESARQTLLRPRTRSGSRGGTTSRPATAAPAPRRRGRRRGRTRSAAPDLELIVLLDPGAGLAGGSRADPAATAALVAATHPGYTVEPVGSAPLRDAVDSLGHWPLVHAAVLPGLDLLCSTVLMGGGSAGPDPDVARAARGREVVEAEVFSAGGRARSTCAFSLWRGDGGRVVRAFERTDSEKHPDTDLGAPLPEERTWARRADTDGDDRAGLVLQLLRTRCGIDLDPSTEADVELLAYRLTER